MDFPVPDVSGFFEGFASCAALLVSAVLVRHALPAAKALIAKAEAVTGKEFGSAVGSIHAKIDALSTNAAGAINAIRGDVTSLHTGLSDVQTRVAALEKAVGINQPAHP